MYEIRMVNGSYFWTPRQPTHLLAVGQRGLVQLGTAANVMISLNYFERRKSAREQLANGQIATTFLNLEHVSSIVDID